MHLFTLPKCIYAKFISSCTYTHAYAAQFRSLHADYSLACMTYGTRPHSLLNSQNSYYEVVTCHSTYAACLWRRENTRHHLCDTRRSRHGTHLMYASPPSAACLPLMSTMTTVERPVSMFMLLRQERKHSGALSCQHSVTVTHAVTCVQVQV